MLLERRIDEPQLKSRDKIVVGYDFGKDYAQISYQSLEMEEPETAALVTGTEIYNIPMVLCKRKSVNQWYWGKEAIKYHEKEGVELITDLYQRALLEEQIEIEEQSYDCIALLTLFMKRSLSLLNMITKPDHIVSMMITVQDLNDHVVDVLGKVTANLDMKKTAMYLQNHQESIYFYMMHQPEELWNRQVIICDFNGKEFRKYKMNCNHRTTPIVVLIDEEFSENMFLPQDWTMEQDALLGNRLDEQLLESMQESCKEGIVNAVYFLGEGFRENWMEKTIKYLCRSRRVFLGNNLFSKGACLSLKDKFLPCENVKTHVFLGKEKLKANLGIPAMKQGKEVYVALLDAGNNWYELENEVTFFLPEDGVIELLVTPLDGKNKVTEQLKLTDIPEREAGCTKVSMKLTMNSVSEVEIEIKDLGFGDIYPGTDKNWIFRLQV